MSTEKVSLFTKKEDCRERLGKLERHWSTYLPETKPIASGLQQEENTLVPGREALVENSVTSVVPGRDALIENLVTSVESIAADFTEQNRNRDAALGQEKGKSDAAFATRSLVSNADLEAACALIKLV